jgi:signal transduction histidine kinase
MENLRLDFDTEINLYRLIQEGLNNVKKHAEAQQSTIRLLAAFPWIILRIEDDGQGFNLKQRMVVAQQEKRMGLRSMEERVDLLGGKMKIYSRISEGTKIFIEVPYRTINDGNVFEN